MKEEKLLRTECYQTRSAGTESLNPNTPRIRQPSIFLSVAALAGVGWTLRASELRVAGQRAIPSWARGRMSAIVIMVSQGAIALGGVVWGFCGQAAGLSLAFVVAALALSISLFPLAQLSIDCTTRRRVEALQYLSS